MLIYQTEYYFFFNAVCFFGTYCDCKNAKNDNVDSRYFDTRFMNDKVKPNFVIQFFIVFITNI